MSFPPIDTIKISLLVRLFYIKSSYYNKSFSLYLKVPIYQKYFTCLYRCINTGHVNFILL